MPVDVNHEFMVFRFGAFLFLFRILIGSISMLLGSASQLAEAFGAMSIGFYLSARRVSAPGNDQ